MPDSLDAHYETVIRELIAGRVILFLGPDVNLCGRPEGLAWSGRQDEHLPSNGELAAHLAEKFRYPSSKTQVSCPTCQSEISLAEKTRNLTRVSQYVAVTRGTGRLYEELHSLFNTEDYLPNAVYEFLSTLPGVLRATVHLHPAGVQAAGAASEERAPWQKYLSRLRRILTTRFDVGELRGLCFDLGVDYDDLPAEGKANKALELVMYLERRRQVPELIKMGKDLRPDIPWPEWPPRTADVLRRQLLIVTTNYDDQLERAFQAAGEPFHLVSYVAEGEQAGRFLHQPPDGKAHLIEQPNQYRGLLLDPHPVILKVHGAVDRVDASRDSFVITEDHYIDYLTHTNIAGLIPVPLPAKLEHSYLLFLGYDLRHWNLRVILHHIWQERELSYNSWAVQPNPDHLNRRLWMKRDVDVIDIRLEDYVAALSERMQALSHAGGA